MNGKFIRASLLQFSGIIGAGVFALPYFLYNSNFFFATLGMFFIALVTAIVNIFYVHVICQTQGDHQLPGYAKKYLGEKFKYIAAISLLVSGLGAVLAYVKLGSSFIQILFPVGTIAAVAIFLLLIVFGYLIKAKSLKLFLDYLPFAIVFIAFLLFQITTKHQLPEVGVQDFNLAFFGVCVFALSGFTVIPEMEEILRGEENIKFKLSLATVLGLAIACVVYLVFCYSVIRLSGPLLSQDSVSGLAESSYFLAWIVSVFGLLATFKGSINFIGVFHEIFYRDFKETNMFSNIAAILLPFASLILFNLSFGSILGWVGAGSIFVSVCVICLMILKQKRNHYVLGLVSLVIAVFVFGFISMI